MLLLYIQFRLVFVSILFEFLKLLVGIIPYVILVFKHSTVYQIVISNVIQGLAVGTTFVAQMVKFSEHYNSFFKTILTDTCNEETFAGATGVNSFFRTIGGAVAPVIISTTMKI